MNHWVFAIRDRAFVRSFVFETFDFSLNFSYYIQQKLLSFASFFKITSFETYFLDLTTNFYQSDKASAFFTSFNSFFQSLFLSSCEKTIFELWKIRKQRIINRGSITSYLFISIFISHSIMYGKKYITFI